MESNDLPASLGYQMPAEWAPQKGVWFTWPRPDGISFPGKYKTVPPVYAELFEQLLKTGGVFVNVANATEESRAKKELCDGGLSATDITKIAFHHYPAHEPWCRDHGPIFVVKESNVGLQKAVTKWKYNAWGDKYPPYDLDNEIPYKIAELRDIPIFEGGMILEGGSIEVNGNGTLLTTTSCLLNQNRNPDLTKWEIEQRLKAYLGVKQIIWLGDGIEGDDTDGHIDDITRFISPKKIITVVEPDKSDPNHAPLKANLELLRQAKDLNGELFEIIELPMPHRLDHEDQRLPASYANFLISNGLVLVPTYRCKNDSQALRILQEHMPDHKVIGIDSTELIWGLGSFHCISQQEPAV